MIEFAKVNFKLNRRLDDGHTEREHLLSAWRQSGIEPREFRECPDFPAQLGALWGDFLALHSRRGGSGFGPLPLTYADLHAWQIVTGSRLEPWELRTILKLDTAYMASIPTQQGNAGGG